MAKYHLRITIIPISSTDIQSSTQKIKSVTKNFNVNAILDGLQLRPTQSPKEHAIRELEIALLQDSVQFGRDVYNMISGEEDTEVVVTQIYERSDHFANVLEQMRPVLSSRHANTNVLKRIAKIRTEVDAIAHSYEYEDDDEYAPPLLDTDKLQKLTKNYNFDAVWASFHVKQPRTPEETALYNVQAQALTFAVLLARDVEYITTNFNEVDYARLATLVQEKIESTRLLIARLKAGAKLTPRIVKEINYLPPGRKRNEGRLHRKKAKAVGRQIGSELKFLTPAKGFPGGSEYQSASKRFKSYQRRRKVNQTKLKKRQSATTTDLRKVASRLQIPGRSKKNKTQLLRAIRRSKTR